MLYTTEISKATKMPKLTKPKQNVQRESAEEKTQCILSKRIKQNNKLKLPSSFINNKQKHNAYYPKE